MRTGFGLGSLYAGGFRRLRAASSFAHGGKGTKTPPGMAQMSASRSLFRLSPAPFYGGYPWARQNPSGAQNQECLSAVPSGPHWGLAGKKIVAGAFPLLRLSSPNQRPGPFSAVGRTVCARGPVWDRPLREGRRDPPYFVGAAHWAARNTSRERTRLRRKNESTSGHTAGTGVLTRPQDRTGSFPHRQAPIFQPANFFPHTPAAARTAPGTPFSKPPAAPSSGYKRSGRRSPGCGAPRSPNRSSGTPAPAGRG